MEQAAPKSSAPVREVSDDAVSLHHYLSILRTYRWTVIAAASVSLGLAILYTFNQDPTYRASALLLLENTPAVLPPVTAGNQSRQMVDPDFLQDQVEVLTNDMALIREVAKRSGWVKDYASQLDPEQRGSMGDEELERDAAASLRMRISVRSRRKRDKPTWHTPATQLVDVAVTDTEAHRAALLANTLSDFFVESRSRKGQETNHHALQWLRAQVQDLETKLKAAETALNAFKRGNSVLFGSVEDGRSVLMTQVRSISNSLSQTRLQRMQLETQLAAVQKALADDNAHALLGEIANTDDFRNLQRRADELGVELVSLAQRYGPLHPKYKDVQATLEALERRHRRRADEVVDGLSRRLDSVRSYEKGLAEALEDVKAEIFSLQDKERDYDHYAWEVKTIRRLHEVVLQRLKETELAGMLQNHSVRVLQPAQTPRRPIRPRVLLNMVAALVVGLGLGLALALLQAYLDDTAKAPEDLQLALGVPFLGTVPNALPALPGRRGLLGWLRGTGSAERDDAQPYVHRQANGGLGEYMRSLRTNLLFMSPDEPMRSLAITSAEAGAGKTTLAVNLAVVMSQTQGKTLLVDADMRSPKLHRIFGVSKEAGLSLAVAGECELDDGIKATEVPGLDLLPSGEQPPNPVELLHSDRFAKLAAELRRRYRIVIYDTPPAHGFADAAVLGKQLDGIILVARWRKSELELLKQLGAQLKELNVSILGAVLNAVQVQRRNYYYGYRYQQQPDVCSAIGVDRP